MGFLFSARLLFKVKHLECCPFFFIVPEEPAHGLHVPWGEQPPSSPMTRVAAPRLREGIKTVDMTST